MGVHRNYSLLKVEFLQYHFVKGELIFTDGRKPWKNYETLRIDESSTEFNTYYSTLNIRPGYDQIEILDSTGSPYVTVHEQAGKTNIVSAYDIDDVSESDFDFVTTGVVHEINSVLIKR